MDEIELKARELLVQAFACDPEEVLIGEVRAVRAVLAYQAELAPQWQPIESAPQSESVLVTFKREDVPKDQHTMPGVMIAYWDAYYAEGGYGHDGIGTGWVGAHSGDQCHLHYGQPSHWMPLPAPPETPND